MFVGIDIGGTTIKAGLIDEQGNVLRRQSRPTQEDRQLLVESIMHIVEEFQKAFSIKGIGISAPGVIGDEGEFITAGALYSLYGINLKTLLEQKFQLPVYVENDANAATIAERWIGNAQGFNNYLCVVLGTGVGGGIVINQQLYRGANGMAGEFGFMLQQALPKTGNLEVSSLNRLGSVIGGICNRYNAISGKPATADAQRIMALSDSGDPIAAKAMNEFYESLATGFINLFCLFEPEAIIVGGAISSNEGFMQQIQNQINLLAVRHEALNYFLKEKSIRLLPAKLKNDAGMVGAVYQLIHSSYSFEKE